MKRVTLCLAEYFFAAILLTVVGAMSAQTNFPNCEASCDARNLPRHRKKQKLKFTGSIFLILTAPANLATTSIGIL